MKKTSKILAVVLVAVLAVATLFVLTACAAKINGTAEGSVKQEGIRGNNKYQAKVEVTVKNSVIESVTLKDLDPDYVWSTRDNYGTKETAQTWVDEAIVGKTVEEVLGWQVDMSTDSEKTLLDGPKFNIVGDEKTTKATETGARIIAAVQDAICKMDGVTKVTGECKYENTHSAGSYYGAKVDVVVINKTIVGVHLYADSETGWTRTTGIWTENQNAGDLGYAKAEAAYAGYIAEKIIGQKVKTIMSWEASATAEGQTVTDGEKLVGATQSSARIIVAIQNALEKL